MRTWALSRATVASTRLAMLNLLVGHHFKALEIGDAEGCRHRDVCCVATASHHNAADAGMVVARVHPVPTPIEKRGGSGSAASARRAGGERPEAASGTTRGAFDWRQPAMTFNDRKDARVNRHHVVVVGAGSGGLETVRALAGRGSASPWSIAAIITCFSRFCTRSRLPRSRPRRSPGRSAIFCASAGRSRGLASVEAVDKAARRVTLETVRLSPTRPCAGDRRRHAYFGHDDWEPSAPGLKTLEDATTIRGRILIAFERAEQEPDETKRAALMTFVIVGAGPTGVELAGTIAELARATLPADFRNIDTGKARIVLIEAGPRVLPAFRPDLSAYAQRSLERLGVEVKLGQAVTECTAEGVVYGGKTLAAATVIWAAGVQASPAAQWLDAPADRAGRLKVEPDLTVPGHPEISLSAIRRSSPALTDGQFRASRRPPNRRAHTSLR